VLGGHWFPPPPPAFFYLGFPWASGQQNLDCRCSDSIQNPANQHSLYICSLYLLDSLPAMASNCPLHFQSLSTWGFQSALDESPVPQLAGEIAQLPARSLAQQTPHQQKGRQRRGLTLLVMHGPLGPGGCPCAPLVYTAPRTCQDILPDRECCKTRSVHLAFLFHMAMHAYKTHHTFLPPQALPSPIADKPAYLLAASFVFCWGFRKVSDSFE